MVFQGFNLHPVNREAFAEVNLAVNEGWQILTGGGSFIDLGIDELTYQDAGGTLVRLVRPVPAGKAWTLSYGAMRLSVDRPMTFRYIDLTNDIVMAEWFVGESVNPMFTFSEFNTNTIKAYQAKDRVMAIEIASDAPLVNGDILRVASLLMDEFEDFEEVLGNA